MRRFTVLVACALLAFGASAFADDAKVGDLVITHPFATPTPAGAKTGGAYLRKIENTGKAPEVLISVSSPVADRVEIHDMKMDGDVMRMREVGKISIAPGKAVMMSPPMGYHIMLMGLHQPLVAGQKVPLTLQFERAGKVEVTADVEKPGGGDAMMQHMH
jgi:periplasmic copper chaperone A